MDKAIIDAISPSHGGIIEAIESQFGLGTTILSKSYASGGCINSTEILKLSNGKAVFLKTSRNSDPNYFKVEVQGLLILASQNELRVPQVLAYGEEKGLQWLLMEAISQGGKSANYWEDFGHGLASMHQSVTHTQHGFFHENLIGSSPQSNQFYDGWIDFYRQERILYQLDLSRKTGEWTKELDKAVKRFCMRLNDLIPSDATPSLLHGDLWGGNVLCDDRGQAVMIDPAVYFGHGEADLAMTELFGRFDRRFYDAYNEIISLDEYSERRDIYQLYHLMNHLNIFGGSYRGSVMSILTRFA